MSVIFSVERCSSCRCHCALLCLCIQFVCTRVVVITGLVMDVLLYSYYVLSCSVYYHTLRCCDNTSLSFTSLTFQLTLLPS